MYSPKISEDLIPHLYRMAKDRRVPMTVLTNQIIKQFLDKIKVIENHAKVSCMAAEKETTYAIKKGGE